MGYCKQQGNTRKQKLEEELERQQKIENLLLEFAKRALQLKIWLESADEALTDPISVDNLEAISYLQTKFQQFLAEHAAKSGELQELKALQSQCQSLKVDEKTFSEVSLEDVNKEWQAVEGLINERRQTLNKEQAKQEANEQLCKSFAQKAKEFHQFVTSNAGAIGEASGTAEEQLNKLRELLTSITAHGSQLQELIALNSSIEDNQILENKHTELTLDILRRGYDDLNVLAKEKEKNLAKEIMSKNQSSKLSPAQLQEFKDCFTHFDKDKDNFLNRLELGSCLKSLGQEISFDEGGSLDKILGQINPSTAGQVTFEEFASYMEKISTTSDTPDSIKSAFKTLAGDKEYVLESDLRAVLPADKVDYLLKNMAPYPGVAGALDYKTFTDSVYSR
eukprot:TRINITY_DN3619_c0_g1_i1.p1 TRINITY_DN3619_c0_g1~~TRINITY_DN3619_c0_g1_i1.p1  ORF type:complete len:393 (-),score=127.41 TRINITY_DN3619_c0_g1_i1:450-1628(-)